MDRNGQTATHLQPMVLVDLPDDFKSKSWDSSSSTMMPWVAFGKSSRSPEMTVKSMGINGNIPTIHMA